MAPCVSSRVCSYGHDAYSELLVWLETCEPDGGGSRGQLGLDSKDDRKFGDVIKQQRDPHAML